MIVARLASGDAPPNRPCVCANTVASSREGRVHVLVPAHPRTTAVRYYHEGISMNPTLKTPQELAHRRPMKQVVSGRLADRAGPRARSRRESLADTMTVLS